MHVLSEHLALRLEAYRRHPPFIGGAFALEKLSKHLTPLHEEGDARVCRRSGRLDAVVVWRLDEESWFGPPVYSIAIDLRADADVEGWLEDTLADVLPKLDAEWDLLLDAVYAPAYRALSKLGAGVDSVQLLGDVERAWARLRAGSMPAGVELDRMRVDDLEPVNALYAETFSREPQFCWFGAHPRFLRRQSERLEEALADDAHLELVLRTDAGVRGHASGTVADNELWGPTAGMSLCFAPEVRGRGVLRPVYRRLLEGMRERGARVFRGGTSQPAVMRLALEMQRHLQGVCMRRRPHFPEAHFAPYLPL